MIEKLRTLKAGTWYSITNRPDREQLLTTIETLIDTGINKGTTFELSPDRNSFRRNELDLFSMIGQPGCRVEKERQGEYLYFENKLIAIR